LTAGKRTTEDKRPVVDAELGFTEGVVNQKHDADEYIHEEHEEFDVKLVDGV
jgi:hypothetical protein